MVTIESTLKLPEMRSRLFDVVHALACAGCMTYFVFNAVDATVDQENHLVLAKLWCLRLSEELVKVEKGEREVLWVGIVCFTLIKETA